MGDEGVGVHVARRLEQESLPDHVDVMDGGTGGLHLLEPLQQADTVVLIDATVDGAPPGTVRRLRPRFSKDYPRTLTAHDIGLKDLLDAMYVLGDSPSVTLLAVSIDQPQELGTELSPEVAAAVPGLVDRAIAETAAGRG
jgi:hydrogenase maturation protease